jgi:hypothetical protein
MIQVSLSRERTALSLIALAALQDVATFSEAPAPALREVDKPPFRLLCSDNYLIQFRRFSRCEIVPERSW